MQQTVTVTVRPEDEPVTLAHAKTHLRIDHDDEDDLIRLWIKAAREYAEVYTDRKFVTQTVQVKLDCWPADGVIRLEQFGGGDVTEVDEITYLDVNGDEQTLDPSLYQAALNHNPPLISPAPLGDWPDVEEDRYYPITIELTVGAHHLDVLAAVKSAILLTMAYWDENRGGAEMETSVSKGLPAAALRLLNSIQTGGYP